MKRCLALMGLAAALSSARPATAMRTAGYATSLSPADGSSVPPDPTLYAFDEDGRAPADVRQWFVFKTGGGRVIPFEVEIVGEPMVYRTARYRLHAKTGEIRVSRSTGYPGAEAVDYRYHVDPKFKAPTGKAVQIIGTSSQGSYVGFDRVLARLLKPSARGIAYRVEWATSEAEYRAGKRNTFLVPAPRERKLPQQYGPLETPGCPVGVKAEPAVISLGTRFPWTPLWVGIAALQADGKETPAARKPLLVRPPDADGEVIYGVEVYE